MACALFGLLLWSPALAGPAEETALKATDVADAHCAGLAADRTTEITSSLIAVASALDAVSRVYAETGAPHLLYWRGVLLQCSSQEERATGDLRAFVDDFDNQHTLLPLVRDALRRLRRLETGPDAGKLKERPPTPEARIVLAEVPAGSTVRVLTEGPDGPVEVVVPAGLGLIDSETGVRLAREVTITAVVGPTEITVRHPRLGEASLKVEIGVDGAALHLDWRAMDGVAAAKAQFQVSRAAARAARTERARRTAEALRPAPVAAGVISVALGITAVAMLGESLTQEAALSPKYELYRTSLRAGGQESATGPYASWSEARVRVERLRWASVAVGGVAVVGLGVTMALGAGGKPTLVEAPVPPL